jgi:hypothetical protein
MTTSITARLAKTVLFHSDLDVFLKALKREIASEDRLARAAGTYAAIRLNNLSDYDWSAFFDMGDFPRVRFYDYTKSQTRYKRYRTGFLPKNYHLTYSVDERPLTAEFAEKVLRLGGNVAVVFAQGGLPTSWQGYPVLDGDLHDGRFLDGPGTVCGLVAKGAARKNGGRFVQVETVA